MQSNKFSILNITIPSTELCVSVHVIVTQNCPPSPALFVIEASPISACPLISLFPDYLLVHSDSFKKLVLLCAVILPRNTASHVNHIQAMSSNRARNEEGGHLAEEQDGMWLTVYCQRQNCIKIPCVYEVHSSQQS